MPHKHGDRQAGGDSLMGILPIGFFAPLPLAIMIPFMAAQSFAMGHAFGTSFQYGKRKISSMTNEEFNALDSVTLHANLQTDIRAMIPSMNESFHRMESFQIEIIQSMMQTLLKAGDAFLQFIRGEGTTTIGSALGLTTDEPGHEEEQGFPEWIPHAHADDSQFTTTETTTPDIKYNAIEKYALRFIKKAGNGWKTTSLKPTLKEVNYLLTESSKGNMPNIPRSIIITLSKTQKQNRPAPLTPTEQQQITKGVVDKTATGIVQKLALMWNTLTFRVNILRKLKSNTKQKASFNNNLKVFLNELKEWNRFVTLNRKSQMQLDTAKSIAQLRLVPK